MKDSSNLATCVAAHGAEVARYPTVELVNVGQVVAGKYRVERVLGIGGMGMVVAATHLDLEQRVALKLMLPGAQASEPAVERFLREARAAVRLRGEHVCRVLDVGRIAGGTPYIVMEYMEGHDLAHVARQRGPMHLAEAIGYALQAIEGVAEAHANGIVHRDLKPANLFITTGSDGSELVKVLDFGISKSSLGGGGGTKTGDIMGTPTYMAPEQMTSSKYVDGRADQWALGVIVYQMLSGRTPFDAETLPALCMAVLTEPPPPLHVVRPDLPRAFCDVVARCLAKRPEQRFDDIAELAVALAPFGPSDAATTAHRICKVLRRSSGAALTLPLPASPPSAHGPATTLQGSAAQVARASAPRRRAGWLVGIGVALVAAVVIGVVALAGRDEAEPRAAGQPGPRAPSSTDAPPEVSPPPPPPPAPLVETIETRAEPSPPRAEPPPVRVVEPPKQQPVAAEKKRRPVAQEKTPVAQDKPPQDKPPPAAETPPRPELPPVVTEPAQPDWNRIQRDKRKN